MNGYGSILSHGVPADAESQQVLDRYIDQDFWPARGQVASTTDPGTQEAKSLSGFGAEEVPQWLKDIQTIQQIALKGTQAYQQQHLDTTAARYGVTAPQLTPGAMTVAAGGAAPPAPSKMPMGLIIGAVAVGGLALFAFMRKKG
jgi:hypothetical protein